MCVSVPVSDPLYLFWSICECETWPVVLSPWTASSISQSVWWMQAVHLSWRRLHAGVQLLVDWSYRLKESWPAGEEATANFFTVHSRGLLLLQMVFRLQRLNADTLFESNSAEIKDFHHALLLSKYWMMCCTCTWKHNQMHCSKVNLSTYVVHAIVGSS